MVALLPNLWSELVNDVLMLVFADVGILLFAVGVLFVLLEMLISLLEGVLVKLVFSGKLLLIISELTVLEEVEG